MHGKLGAFILLACVGAAGASQATGPWARLGLCGRLPPTGDQVRQAEQAAAQDTGEWWFAWELACLYARAGRTDDARGEAARCSELDGVDPGMVRRAEAQIALADGDLAGAESSLREAVGQVGRSAYSWALWRDIGDLALMAPDGGTRAREAFETALLVAFAAPSSWRAWDELATDVARVSPAADRPLWLTTASALSCAEGRGKEQQAPMRRQMAQSLEAVSALYPPRAASLIAEAYLYRWLQSPAEAKEALRAAIAADSGCLAAHLDLAGLLLGGAQTTEAQAEYAQVVQLAGPLADVAGEAHLHLSRISADAGEWKSALQHYCSAWLNLELGLDTWEPARLAYLALRADDAAPALSVLQEHDHDLRVAGYGREAWTLDGVRATLQGAARDYAAMQATVSDVAQRCADLDGADARVMAGMCREIATMGAEAAAPCLRVLFVRSGDNTIDSQMRVEWIGQAREAAPGAPLPRILLAMELLATDRQSATALLREAQAALPPDSVLWRWAEGLLR